MLDLKKKINTIVSELEEKIKDKEDLEYIKAQIYNISLIFLDEIDRLAEMNLGKMNALMEKEKKLSQKISAMEKTVKEIEREMYISEDFDFTIQCPYCNTEFVEDFTDGYKHEVKCPECDNVIQLEWSADDECDCGHECNGNCAKDDESEDGENDSKDEDDM